MWVKTEEEYLKAKAVLDEFNNSLINETRGDYLNTLNNQYGGSHTKWFINNIFNKKKLIFGLGALSFLLVYLFTYYLIKFK